ncbi:MAG: hypothetical protein DRP09_10525 [Candidatus Thorarchaeota archaeon]|nr:MAG: hypothetical protein DRP09_10525 [Candidatus Thorarchaeota archaeon]
MKTRTRTMDEKGGFVETTQEEQSSCTIKQSAKGALSFEMKIYDDDPENYKERAFEYLKAIKEVMDEAQNLGLAMSE